MRNKKNYPNWETKLFLGGRGKWRGKVERAASEIQVYVSKYYIFQSSLIGF